MTLTLAAAVAHTDTGVKVSYTKPGTGSNNKLQDGAAANEVAGFADQAVTNNTAAPDTTAPTLSSATVDGTALVITFNETLAAAASLANSAFAVKKTPSQGGSEQTASLSGSPSISGATVTLTLAAAAAHDDTGVKVSYTKPGTDSNNRLEDGAGNEVADFADQAVTNNTVDITTLVVPTGLMGEAGASGITLSWTAPSDATQINAYGIYKCTLPCTDSGLAYVAGVPPAGSLGNAPTTYLDTAVTAGTTYRYAVTAAYTTSNNESDKSSSITVTVPAVDTTAPTVSSATVDGTVLVITFNETLAAAASLANSAFAVKKTPSQGGSEQTAEPERVAVHQRRHGDADPGRGGGSHNDTGVKVSYTKPGLGQQQQAARRGRQRSGQFYRFQAVTNNTAAPRLAPTGLMAEVGASGITLSWTAPSDATEIIGYGVYFCTLPCMDSDLEL